MATDSINDVIVAFAPLAIVPRLHVTGAHAKEQLRNMQIEAQRYAYEHGTDKPEIDQWKWTNGNPGAAKR